MIKKSVAIIDYGMGNLRSVENAVKKLEAKVKIISIPTELVNHDSIILPGVGSFKKAVKMLHEKNWIEEIKNEALNKKKPFLGICLGMQLLASESEEFGFSKGLDLIKGKIKFLGNLGCRDKVPHIGWNSVSFTKDHYLFKGISNKADFYFVNSFVFVPENKNHNLANTNYDINFCSIVAKDNIYGVQFHPEKSSKAGRKLLKNFLNA